MLFTAVLSPASSETRFARTREAADFVTGRGREDSAIPVADSAFVLRMLFIRSEENNYAYVRTYIATTTRKISTFRSCGMPVDGGSAETIAAGVCVCVCGYEKRNNRRALAYKI